MTLLSSTYETPSKCHHLLSLARPPAMPEALQLASRAYCIFTMHLIVWLLLLRAPEKEANLRSYLHGRSSR